MTARLLPALTALVLLVAIALLGLGLVRRLTHETDISPIAENNAGGRGGEVTAGPLPDWEGLDPARYTAIVEAPLFIEGRRMPDDIREAASNAAESEPEPEAPPAAPVAEPDASLLGILIAPEGSKALVASGAQGAETWVVENDRLGDWSVDTIAQDHIILRHESELRRLNMRR
ncbi:hypothetical protein C8N35_103240 [Breoghania corrubedonensis]|uniref:Type II secretion system (T2SS) protein C n=1 Tax=Breoghania corrubedonensis TaxID=665038 RepID=A0A2T5VBC6_9HYPH|nr:hypothetical protein [Breoghania corrubedonensis]PTW61058.1 hypothetical protein C8N35_103240 [Breoghania corrubedonensis]